MNYADSIPDVQHFSARGKLLLSGEYLVAHGGLALAMPVRFGQKLAVKTYGLLDAAALAEMTAKGQDPDSLRIGFVPSDPKFIPGPPRLHWDSCGDDGYIWLSARLSLMDLSTDYSSAYGLDGHPDLKAYEPLAKLLKLCRELKPDFLTSGEHTYWAITECDFPRNWGLGTSSTLVSLVAQWAGVDPFALQKAVFGGSGYDVACATASGPILYKLVNGQPRWETVDFSPPFSEQLYFVHLGKKQDSRFSLAAFEARGMNPAPWLNTIVHLTMQLRFAETLSDFSEHLRKHEEVIAALTGFTPVQALHFADFPGVVKSLGAWGGDFVLAATALPESEVRAYFENRGFTTVLAWREMV